MYSYGKLKTLYGILWLKKLRCKNHVNCAVSNHKVKVALNSARQSYSTWLYLS